MSVSIILQGPNCDHPRVSLGDGVGLRAAPNSSSAPKEIRFSSLFFFCSMDSGSNREAKWGKRMEKGFGIGELEFSPAGLAQ